MTIHVAREGAPLDTVYSIPGDRTSASAEAINSAFAEFYSDYNMLRAPVTVTSVDEDEAEDERVSHQGVGHSGGNAH